MKSFDLEDKSSNTKKSSTILNISENHNFLMQMYLYSKYLISQPLYRILLLLYCLGNCSVITMGSLINIISTNFGFKSVMGSIVALGVIILGLTSSVIYSIYFIRKKNQTLILASYCVVCIFSILLALISAIKQ